jgi:ADP-heptose:LPS heptosyltransferase
VRFVSLQKGPAGAEARAAGFELLDPMDQARDFADTAALVANLDLVISVDTSVVHLAGAMGKPVFLLDRYDNCWRWLSGREDSPWYPTLRIFRQRRSGEWGPVIERVATALAAMAARPCRAPRCRDAA